MLLGHEKNENLPFATTWMDLEDIMWNESDIGKYLYMEFKKYNKLATMTRKMQTHR